MFGRSLRGSVAATHDVTPSAQVVPVQRSPPGQRPMDGTGRPVASCSGQQGGTVPEPSCDAEYKVAGGSHGTTRQRALIASAIAEADTPGTASTRNARARTIAQGLRAAAAACPRRGTRPRHAPQVFPRFRSAERDGGARALLSFHVGIFVTRRSCHHPSPVPFGAASAKG